LDRKSVAASTKKPFSRSPEISASPIFLLRKDFVNVRETGLPPTPVTNLTISENDEEF
jgi:hypothetical protein